MISFEEILSWFRDNSQLGIGIFLVTIGIIFTISEIKVYFKHQSPPDQLLLWSNVLVAGIITLLFNDAVFGFLVGVSVIMIVETYKLWDVPVWGKLMAATTASYMVILSGKAGQIFYDRYVNTDNTNEFIFSLAFNISFFVFLGVAFAFFGRKFILVSRLSSPQMIYLFLFGMVYGGLVLLQRQEIIFKREDGVTQSYDYLGLSADWTDKVIFANFGTFEALAILIVFMYLISGWLLSVLFGVKPITDPVLLAKVREVAKKMGIKEEIKVGFVSVPILNAFAYGPFFDKRIAFMASDIEQFTDSDIRGIVGHELAHASKHHLVWLTLLSIFELGVKKGLNIPATTLDYTFFADDAVKTLSFAGYYVFSYAFLIILLIAVRILEGHADKVTKEAGYGEDLSNALFKLEGFYHGVASDFGISVNLLTDRRYTVAESRRFTAIAGSNLYSEIISPTRGSAFANILQSHPRTSYRIASLVSDKISPIRAAFFPYRLLGFGLRKNAIKELNKLEEEYHKIIDKAYLQHHSEEAISEVLRFNPIKEIYDRFINVNVIAFDQISKNVVIGVFNELIQTNRVTSPIEGIIGNNSVDLAKVILKEYYPGEKYFLRNGSIGVLKSHKVVEKKGLVLEIEIDDEIEEVTIAKLGKPVSFIENLAEKEIVIFDKGISKLKTIDKIELGNSWNTTKLHINGEIKLGSNYIVDFPPLGFEIRPDKLDDQKELLHHLIGKKALIYTKDNFDVSLSGEIESIDSDNLILIDADGAQEIKLKRLEYIVYDEPIVELVTKDHISIFTKAAIRWSNRNEFNYIVG